MRQQNNRGLTEKTKLQIQFTAYLSMAVKRRRKDYIKWESRYHTQVFLVDEIYEKGSTLEQQMVNMFPWEDIADRQSLMTVLNRLKERERYVFLSRTLDDRSFESLATQLGLSYKGVYAIYYRTLKKLRRHWKEMHN